MLGLCQGIYVMCKTRRAYIKTSNDKIQFEATVSEMTGLPYLSDGDQRGGHLSAGL